MTRKRKPLAFMSYVRDDDEDEQGRLTKLRERLSTEMCLQTGKEFEIFQDRENILWGQNWKQGIEDSLNEVTFLIPIITPRFFKSKACRDELKKFIKREQKLNRNDLIFPLYYIDSRLLNDKSKWATDPLAQAAAKRQYADWRELRFEPFDSATIRKALAQLAVQIRKALERLQTR